MKMPLLLLVPLAFCAAQTQNAPSEHMLKEVRHELVMMPYLSIFDNLSFRVDGDTVILMGQVTRPDIRSNAEKVVKRVEGVEQVVDQIEVLPLSKFDQQIRRDEYLALARNPQLSFYFYQTAAPIRIIVKNGYVTLDGVVGSKADYDLAAMVARTVPGIFSLTNKLEVAGGK